MRDSGLVSPGDSTKFASGTKRQETAPPPSEKRDHAQSVGFVPQSSPS